MSVIGNPITLGGSSGGGGNSHYCSLTVTNTVDRNWIKFTHNIGAVPKIIRVRSTRAINGEITTVPDDLALGEIAYEFVSVETLFNLSGEEQLYRGVTAARNAVNQRFGVAGSPTLNWQSSMPVDYAGNWNAFYVSDTEVFLSSGLSNYLYLAGITYFVEVWG